MAPKEDMLPPGWEDLDRYVDLLFRRILPQPCLSALSAPSPRVVEPQTGPRLFPLHRAIQAISIWGLI